MSSAWQPKHIILLDDESSVLFALKLLLGALGFTVEAFCSPHDALAFAVKDDKYELFICDLRMPGLSGLQVLEETKKLRPTLPFVLMSAHAGDDEVDKAKILGADGFLSKPFTPDDLFMLISELGQKVLGQQIVK